MRPQPDAKGPGVFLKKSGQIEPDATTRKRVTGGYAIAIDEVLEGGEGLTARVVEMSPAPGCVVAPVITAPVTAVVVPRNDGTVMFVEETGTQACG